MDIYMKNAKRGIDAKAYYNCETKECIVLKGSIVSQTISQAPTFRGAKAIIMNREHTVEDCVVKKRC